MYTISAHLDAPPARRSPREPLFYALSADLQPPDEICSICREPYPRRARSNLNPEAPAFVPPSWIARPPLMELEVMSRSDNRMLRAPRAAAIRRVSRGALDPPSSGFRPDRVRYGRGMRDENNTVQLAGAREEQAQPVTVVTERFRSYSENWCPIEECARVLRQRARSVDLNVSFAPTYRQTRTMGSPQTLTASNTAQATPMGWTQYVYTDAQHMAVAEERESSDITPVRVACRGNHVFHFGCLTTWFKTVFQDENFDAPLTCPMCRHIVRRLPQRDRALTSELRFWKLHIRRPQIALHFWFPTFVKCLLRVTARVYPLHHVVWDDTEVEDEQNTRGEKLMLALDFTESMSKKEDCPTYIAFWKPDPSSNTLEVWTNEFFANVFSSIDYLMDSDEVVAIWHGLLYKTALLGLWALRKNVDPLSF